MVLGMQDLSRQVEQLTAQLQGVGDVSRVRELELERRLAEERVAELEAQLDADGSPNAATVESAQANWSFVLLLKLASVKVARQL